MQPPAEIDQHDRAGDGKQRTTQRNLQLGIRDSLRKNARGS